MLQRRRSRYVRAHSALLDIRRAARRRLATALAIGTTIAAPTSAIAADVDYPGVVGDPAGARSAAEARGLSFDATLVGDYSLVLDGGANPRASAARYLIGAGITLDTETAIGWPGGTFRAAYLGFHGEPGSRETGDIQGYSNIDAAAFDALYALWYRQALFDDRLAIKVGKMDANTDFAYVENGLGFIHSSPGVSPTLFTFPTYPDPASAIALFAQLPAGGYARAGVYDGSSVNGRRTGTRGPRNFLIHDSDRFTVGELGVNYVFVERDGRLGMGYWHHNGTFERFDGHSADHADGFYVVWDQSLYADAASSFAVDGFAQYGEADEAVSELSSHIGAGLEIVGLLSDRPDDVTGVMASRVNFSNARGAAFSADHETAIEVFHAIQITDWMALKPDFQYIVHPGGMGLDDAQVATLRAEIDL